MLLPAAGAVMVAVFLFAAATAGPGGDYFADAGGPIDALVRANLHEFFANQPLMGPLSLLVRAPFVAAVFHSSESAVYYAGVVPCVAALAGLTFGLLRRMERDGRSESDRAIVVAVLLLSPLTVRAIHWGHPEEILGSVLCVAAVICAARGGGLLPGLLLGLAFATKQWAVIAGVPVLLAAPREQRLRLVAAGAAVALVFTAPLYLGNPDRFMQVLRAAASADPQAHLHTIAETGPKPPGIHVTPTNLWWPASTAHESAAGTIYMQAEILGRLSHPLIVLLPIPLGLLLWRRRGRLDVADAASFLALLFLLRGLLDQMSLDYYHVPVVVALAVAAARGGTADVRRALLGTAGLGLAFALPAASMYEVSANAPLKAAVYLAVGVALALSLAWRLFARRRPVIMAGHERVAATAG
jgi:hypothetical protein